MVGKKTVGRKGIMVQNEDIIMFSMYIVVVIMMERDILCNE